MEISSDDLSALGVLGDQQTGIVETTQPPRPINSVYAADKNVRDWQRIRECQTHPAFDPVACDGPALA
jgi:hypothetical protein